MLFLRVLSRQQLRKALEELKELSFVATWETWEPNSRERTFIILDENKKIGLVTVDMKQEIVTCIDITKEGTSREQFDIIVQEMTKQLKLDKLKVYGFLSSVPNKGLVNRITAFRQDKTAKLYLYGGKRNSGKLVGGYKNDSKNQISSRRCKIT